MQRESGFTLIELLTVISIISICALLGMTSFYEYRGDAAYSVVNSLVSDTQTAVEASLVVPDVVLPSVGSFTQTVQGPPSDVSAKAVLPGLMIPRKTSFQFSFDPTCEDASCEVARVQVKHCQGRDYLRWIRYGDGLDVKLEHIAGIGCN